MRTYSLLLLAAAAALSACGEGSPTAARARVPAPLHAARGAAIHGAYLVVLRDGADPAAVARVAGVAPRHLYAAALRGFAGALNAGQVEAGGGLSTTLNTAVTNLSSSGVFVAVAAGNENQDACNVSPASAAAVFTTAATNSDDTRRSTSNHGPCVDGYAPGGSITSTWIGSGTATLSGSSMAAPHVAGVAALYKATFGDAASSAIDSWIKTNATAGVVKNVPAGTPNRLLYKAALLGAAAPPPGTDPAGASTHPTREDVV